MQVILAPDPARSEEFITVYVTGAIHAPGVYKLRGGERAAALIDAAGGASEGADLERVNLAARLKDGEQLHIPRQGEATPAANPGGRLNLNRATQRDLDALPGIGAVRAQRIVASRDRDGPFKDPFDLVTRSLVPLSVYQQLKDLVSAP